MYKKNLTEDLRLRLSEKDMKFLRDLSNDRCITISECIRSIIAEYRRSCEVINALTKANIVNQAEETGGCPNGDTETTINDFI